MKPVMMEEEITITMKGYQWLDLLVDLDWMMEGETLEPGSHILIDRLYEQGVKL
jgi:hypothetical protein